MTDTVTRTDGRTSVSPLGPATKDVDLAGATA